MTARRPIVVGNWKLHKTIAEAIALVDQLVDRLRDRRDVDVGVAPVFTALAATAARIEGSALFVAGQDCHWEERGAWTGEVSPSLLADAGCGYVIIGHSERRQHFGETDQGVARKLGAALAAGLSAIVCVGETESERDAGQTTERIRTQLQGALGPLRGRTLERVVIAYEPVWAIGTGRTATPAQAQDVHQFIRRWLRDHFGDLAGAVRIQYGGSVKAGNAAELMAQADIDGALVGGASLAADEFVAIVDAARPG